MLNPTCCSEATSSKNLRRPQLRSQQPRKCGCPHRKGELCLPPAFQFFVMPRTSVAHPRLPAHHHFRSSWLWTNAPSLNHNYRTNVGTQLLSALSYELAALRQPNVPFLSSLQFSASSILFDPSPPTDGYPPSLALQYSTLVFAGPALELPTTESQQLLQSFAPYFSSVPLELSLTCVFLSFSDSQPPP